MTSGQLSKRPLERLLGASLFFSAPQGDALQWDISMAS